MTGREHPRAPEVFEQACELAGDERRRYLDEACADDVDLRAAVERLLAFDRESLDFLSEREVERGRQRLEQLADDVHDELRGPPLERVGPYRVLRRIGEGGMGIVYEAEQDSPRRRVALKVVRPTLARGTRIARFRQEAELLGRLQHPGIACVYESGTFDQGQGEQPYFALEMVDGEDLAAHVARRRTPVHRRLELLAEVCDAVQHAHERGVIHRDLKPDNILVDRAGRTKILDFGVARATEGSTVLTTLVTEDGDLLGTIAYMAPEQVEGRLDAISPRTDVYALGAMAFELLSGRLPHDVVGLPLAAAMQLVREKDPPHLRELRPELVGDVDTIVGKALAKEPEQRYASAAALAADLRAFLEHRPIAARPPSRVYRVRKFTRRHRGLVGGAGATLLALLLGLVAALELADRENDQRLVAEQNNREAQVNSRRVLGQLLQTAQERLERGDAWGAAMLHREVDEGLRGWAWDLQARVLPRLLPAAQATSIWVDAEQLLVGDPARGFGTLEAASRRVTRAITPPPGEQFRYLYLDGALLVGNEFAPMDWATGELGERCDLGASADELVRFPASRRSPAGRLVVAVCSVTDRECRVFVDGVEAWRRDDLLATCWIPPDASRVVLFTEGGELWIHDALSGERQGVVPDMHVSSVPRLVFSSDSRYAYGILRGYERMARFDLQTLEVQPLPESVVVADEFALSPDDRLLATSPLGALTICDLTTGEVVRRERVFPDHARTGHDKVSFSPDGRQLATYTEEHGAYLIDLDEPPRTAAEVGTDEDPRVLAYREHGSYVYDLAIAPDGRLAASATPEEASVRVWDLDDGRTLAVLPKGRPPNPGQARRNLLCFTPDGRHLLMTTDTGEGVELFSWDLVTGEATRTAPRVPGTGPHEQWLGAISARFGDAAGRLGRVAAKPAGRPAWLVFEDSTDEVGDEGWRPFRPDERFKRALAASPDGTRVATAHDRVVYVYDAASGARLAQYYSPAYGLAYSPDGRLLAAGGVDGRVRLYDVEHDVQVFEFAAHDDYVFSLAWSPVGPRLVTASGDGSVKVWDARARADKLEDRRVRSARLDALRALDDGGLRERWTDAEADVAQRGDVLRVLLERR